MGKTKKVQVVKRTGLSTSYQVYGAVGSRPLSHHLVKSSAMRSARQLTERSGKLHIVFKTTPVAILRRKKHK